MSQRHRRSEASKGGVVGSVARAVLGGIGRMADALAPNDNLNAMDLLKAQHRYVEKLFARIGKAQGPSKAAAFRELADMLAVHATIEERIFYPNVKTRTTEALLQESVEEHLAMKRTLADLMETHWSDEEFAAKIKVLEEQVTHHATGEEEKKLFPLVRGEQDADFLAALAGEMIALMVTLQQRGEPRAAVPAETSEPASV